MKKILAILLAAVFALIGCTTQSNSDKESVTITTESITISTEPYTDSVDNEINSDYIESLGFTSLDDPNLLRYFEDSVYSDLVSQLNSDDYFVENVSTKYISKEYIEELEYNSQANIFFGYTLSELDEQFQGKRYVFTLGEDGQTTVKEFEEFSYDFDFNKVIKNVAIGSGVILVCVTVSTLTGGAFPAVSMVFAASAKTATTFAISSTILSGASAAIVKGIQSGDFEEAMLSGISAGSEGFKWGAVSGALAGGISEGTSLYGAAKQTEFTMNQFAKIQKETGYPLDVIKEFHTMKEYETFRDANLKSTIVGNKSALIKSDIDLARIDSKGRTNLQRMQQGLAPQDSSGISYELHHVGQKKDGTLAILTQSEHDNPAIHGFLERTEAHAEGNNWDAERQAFWKAFASMVG